MKKNLKISIISLLVVLGFIGSYFLIIRPYFPKNNYNSLVDSAKSAVESEEYDKAINLYVDASRYNKTNFSEIIEHIKTLKTSKENYESALQQINNKQYLEAIDTLKKVDKQDTVRYPAVEQLINQCRSKYVSHNIETSKSYAKDNKYTEAIAELDKNIALDNTNAESQNLKSEYLAAIKLIEKESGKDRGRIIDKSTVKINDIFIGLKVTKLSISDSSLNDIRFDGDVTISGRYEYGDTGDGLGYVFILDNSSIVKLPTLKGMEVTILKIHNNDSAKNLFKNETGSAKIVINNYSIGERQIYAGADIKKLISTNNNNANKKVKSVEQALQIVINSNSFKKLTKNLKKISNTEYIYESGQSESSSIKLDTSVEEPFLADDNIDGGIAGKYVYIIEDLGDYANNRGHRYYVEVETGKLYESFSYTYEVYAIN